MRLRMMLPILLVIVLASKCHADCPNTLKLCLDVVTKANAVIADDKATISQYTEKSALDEQIKTDQQKQLESPLRDPVKVALGTTVLIIVLELVTGHIK